MAYKSLEVPEAKRLLLLTSDSELADYALEVKTALCLFMCAYACLLKTVYNSCISTLNLIPQSIARILIL